MNEKINKRITENWNLIKWKSEQRNVEQELINLIEREQSFLIDLLEDEQVKQLNKQRKKQ
tara:strand:- start:2801 stop:2980 length:180 start_codon:yes stop_codon:yes gene_type:complete